MLKHKANPAIAREGRTPMHMAAGYARAQTLKVLVAAGADETVNHPQQGTPLDVVLALGNYQIDIFLNRTGADKMKKKDDKLEELKKCLEVLEDPATIKAESSWDELLEDVLKLVVEADALS